MGLGGISMRDEAQAKGEEWRKEGDEQRWCDRLWLGSIQTVQASKQWMFSNTCVFIIL